MLGRTLPIVALAAALTTGCDTGAPPTTGAPPQSGPPPTAAPGEIRLPLDPYLLSVRQSTGISRAYGVLVSRCLRRFGITAPEQPGSGPTPTTMNERRYGITDAALAAVAGYRLSADEPDAGPDRAAVVSAGPPDPYTGTVLAGVGARVVRGERVPPGGCSGEAKRRLAAGTPKVADAFLAQRLSSDSFFASQRDPRVKSVIGAWSECMRARGFDYPSPLKVGGDVVFEGPVGDLELRAAAADLACKRRTRLVGVWSGVEAELQRPAVAANRSMLERIRRWNEAQLRVARDLGAV